MCSQKLSRSWIKRGWLAGAVAVGLLTPGCAPDYVTDNSAPVNLYVAGVTPNVLPSDVRSGVDSTFTCADFASVGVAVRMKNPLVDISSQSGDGGFHRQLLGSLLPDGRAGRGGSGRAVSDHGEPDRGGGRGELRQHRDLDRGRPAPGEERAAAQHDLPDLRAHDDGGDHAVRHDDGGREGLGLRNDADRLRQLRRRPRRTVELRAREVAMQRRCVRACAGALGATGAVVLLLLSWGCKLDRDTDPNLQGPSDVGISVDLVAAPDTVNADGVSTSEVSVVLRDNLGKPLVTRPILFQHNGDGVLIAAPGALYVGPVQTGISL